MTPKFATGQRVIFSYNFDYRFQGPIATGVIVDNHENYLRSDREYAIISGTNPITGRPKIHYRWEDQLIPISDNATEEQIQMIYSLARTNA